MTANKKGASLENVRPGQEAPSENRTNHKTFRIFLQSEAVLNLLIVAWLALNILSLFLETTK